MIKLGVDEADVNTICTENQVIKVMSQCKTSHDGPVITIEALHKLVQEKSIDDKELHKCLNLEIRFRKFTLTEVKSSCPLFRQKGLSVQEKLQNLEALIDSQLNFKALASMSDLEAAIGTKSKEGDDDLTDIGMEVDEDDKEKLNRVSGGEAQFNSLSNSVDKELFQKDQFVLALFTDGAYPVQVVELVTDDKINLNCLSPLIIGGEKNFRLWKWPSSFGEEKEETIDIASVLPNQSSFRHFRALQ